MFGCVQLFAQNTLLEKAKKYEQEKNWVYALGTYYDAIEASNGENEDAINGFLNLKEEILAGNPGRGEFDRFSVHDEWRKLLISAEKYWTEFTPIGIEIKELEHIKDDFAMKTSDYNLNYNYYFTEKYDELIKILRTGCDVKRKDDWKDIPVMESWPSISVFSKNDGTVTQIYQKYGVALVDNKKNGDTNYYSPFYAQEFINCETYGDLESLIFIDPAEAGTVAGILRSIQILNFNIFLPDIKFAICDLNNKEIYSGKRMLVEQSTNDFKYSFKSVPAEVVKIIESGKYEIRVSAIVIQYGEFQHPTISITKQLVNDFKLNGSSSKKMTELFEQIGQYHTEDYLRQSIKKLPEINVLDKIALGKKKYNLNEIFVKKIKDEFESDIVELKRNIDSISNTSADYRKKVNQIYGSDYDLQKTPISEINKNNLARELEKIQKDYEALLTNPDEQIIKTQLVENLSHAKRTYNMWIQRCDEFLISTDDAKTIRDEFNPQLTILQTNINSIYETKQNYLTKVKEIKGKYFDIRGTPIDEVEKMGMSNQLGKIEVDYKNLLNNPNNEQLKQNLTDALTVTKETYDKWIKSCDEYIQECERINYEVEKWIKQTIPDVIVELERDAAATEKENTRKKIATTFGVWYGYAQNVRYPTAEIITAEIIFGDVPEQYRYRFEDHSSASNLVFDLIRQLETEGTIKQENGIYSLVDGKDYKSMKSGKDNNQTFSVKVEGSYDIELNDSKNGGLGFVAQGQYMISPMLFIGAEGGIMPTFGDINTFTKNDFCYLGCLLAGIRLKFDDFGLYASCGIGGIMSSTDDTWYDDDLMPHNMATYLLLLPEIGMEMKITNSVGVYTGVKGTIPIEHSICAGAVVGLSYSF